MKQFLDIKNIYIKKHSNLIYSEKNRIEKSTTFPIQIKQHITTIILIAIENHNKYQKIDIKDYIQQAYIFAFDALEKYDEEKSNLNTFLIYYINRRIGNWAQQQDMVRQKSNCKKIKQTYEQLSYDDTNEEKFKTEEANKDEEDHNKFLIKKLINGANLTPLQKQIVQMYYYEEKNQAEIAKEIGCTRQNINEQHKILLNKLKNGAEKK